MTALGYTIPTAGVSSFAVAAPEVDSALQAILDWSGGNIDGVNVASTLTGRRLIGQAHAFIGPAAGSSGLYYLGADGSINLATSASVAKPFFWWYIDPANYAVAGKSNTQFILRGSLTCAVAPGITISPAVNALTIAGAAGQITPVSGSSVLTGGGAALSSNDQTTVVEGTAATLPSAGAYVPLLQLSGATAANSATVAMLQLFVLNS